MRFASADLNAVEWHGGKGPGRKTRSTYDYRCAARCRRESGPPALIRRNRPRKMHRRIGKSLAGALLAAAHHVDPAAAAIENDGSFHEGE